MCICICMRICMCICMCMLTQESVPRLGVMLREMQRKLAASYDHGGDGDDDDDEGVGDSDEGEGEGGAAAVAAAATVAGGELRAEAAGEADEAGEAAAAALPRSAWRAAACAPAALEKCELAAQVEASYGYTYWCRGTSHHLVCVSTLPPHTMGANTHGSVCLPCLQGITLYTTFVTLWYLCVTLYKHTIAGGGGGARAGG